jgi:predicted Zn-dependent peptidase
MRLHRDVLPSGLTVVTIEVPHLHSAMCAVYVRVGSRHETPANNGVTHMLEHLLFRGSKRWPDSIRMNAAVEAVGGNLNGVTMRDSSTFYTPVHPEGVEVALAVLGDMLTRPRLTAIDIEKRVILEEMLDEVDEKGRDIDIDNLAKKTLYGAHPMGLKIAGTPRSVRRLTRQAVQRHFRKHYVTGNVVVAVAGPVRRAKVVQAARRAFAHLPKGTRNEEQAPPPPRRGEPRVSFTRLEESQVVFRLSFPAVAEDHPDSAGLNLLRRVLDDGLSSRLPYTVVEQRGLAYEISSVYEAWHDTGAFEIDGACAPAQVHKVVETVLETLATLRAGHVTKAELARAKSRYRMHLDFLQDSPGELCGWFGGGELFHRTESFEAKAKEAEAVSAKALVALARRYLVAEGLEVLAVGPREAKRPLERVAARAAKLLGA